MFIYTDVCYYYYYYIHIYAWMCVCVYVFVYVYTTNATAMSARARRVRVRDVKKFCTMHICAKPVIDRGKGIRGGREVVTCFMAGE